MASLHWDDPLLVYSYNILRFSSSNYPFSFVTTGYLIWILDIVSSFNEFSIKKVSKCLILPTSKMQTATILLVHVDKWQQKNIHRKGVFRQQTDCLNKNRIYNQDKFDRNPLFCILQHFPPTSVEYCKNKFVLSDFSMGPSFGLGRVLRGAEYSGFRLPALKHLDADSWVEDHSYIEHPDNQANIWWRMRTFPFTFDWPSASALLVSVMMPDKSR